MSANLAGISRIVSVSKNLAAAGHQESGGEKKTLWITSIQSALKQGRPDDELNHPELATGQELTFHRFHPLKTKEVLRNGEGVHRMLRADCPSRKTMC
jgi:hypothetical protein